MTAPLLVVTGTGTGIGKTVVAAALVSAWARRGIAVAGIKPIESGVSAASALGDRRDVSASGGADENGDVGALGRVSTFHVTRFTPPYLFASPVSPHLAARREGREIDLSVVVEWVAPIRSAADAVVLELPGGLFSPLTDTATNADLVRALLPSNVVIVAPDRLGVLHDLIATTRAARGAGLGLDGIILSAPSEPDASTGTNVAELARTLPDVPVLGSIPRGPSNSLTPHLERVLQRLGL